MTESLSALQWARSTVTNASACQGVYNIGYDTPASVCVQSPARNASACSGDSGSPLLASTDGKDIIGIGVDSYEHAQSVCDPNYPVVFMSMKSTYRWITDTINSLTSPGTLSVSGAKAEGRLVLQHVIARAYAHRRRASISCKRNAATRVTCEHIFISGANLYNVFVTIRQYVAGQGQLFWISHWRLVYASDRCENSKHWRRCHVTSRSGNW